MRLPASIAVFATLVGFPGRGHAPHVEAPEDFDAALLKALSASGPASAP